MAARTNVRKPVRLQVQVSAPDKKLIEKAALQSGQTVNEFAKSALIHAAARALGIASTTYLSARDGEALMKALDDDSQEPNAALKAAARRYRKLMG